MVNNFKEILEKEITYFLESKVKNRYNLIEHETVNESEIAISLEPIGSSDLPFQKGHFAVRLIILDNYNEIHISKLLCTGVFRGKGMAKKLIELIYHKGKEHGYETYLVDVSPSFFDSMRRRKVEIINKEILKITDETDLTSVRKTPKPFTNEIARCKNVKEEFLPYLPSHSNAISFLKWKQRQIDNLLSDINFPRIRKITKEDDRKVLFPVFNLEYITNTYFNPEDPYSLDKELCEQFYFYIWRTNPIIKLLKQTGTGYTIIGEHEHEICTLNSGEFSKYNPVYFKDINDLKIEMSDNLNTDILNILTWAKNKNKLILHILNKKPLR